MVDTIKDGIQRWDSGAGASAISASPLVALASWVAIIIIASYNDKIPNDLFLCSFRRAYLSEYCEAGEL